jgi:LysM repeat protein
VYLLIAPPTLPHEQDRTGAAAPSASPVPGSTGPAAGGAATPPAGSPTSQSPSDSPAEASPSPSGSPQPAQRHTIQAGDTLLGIAERYDTTVDAIRAANPGLSETALTIGQEITIPPGR